MWALIIPRPVGLETNAYSESYVTRSPSIPHYLSHYLSRSLRPVLSLDRLPLRVLLFASLLCVPAPRLFVLSLRLCAAVVLPARMSGGHSARPSFDNRTLPARMRGYNCHLGCTANAMQSSLLTISHCPTTSFSILWFCNLPIPISTPGSLGSAFRV